MKRKLTITLTEEELDTICNALCSYSIRYIDKFWGIYAHKIYIKICKLIPDEWGWSGDIEGEE
jgi:hypothetical protein